MLNQEKLDPEIKNQVGVTEIYETIIDYIFVVRGLIQLRMKEDRQPILDEIDRLTDFINLYLRKENVLSDWERGRKR